MGNMSYCRFENTLSDLYEVTEVMRDVINGNSDEYELILSDSELRAFNALAEICARYLEAHSDLVMDNRVISQKEAWAREDAESDN